MIQLGPAAKAPKDFGVEDQVEPKSIMALYEGTFTPTESGEFRFYAKEKRMLKEVHPDVADWLLGSCVRNNRQKSSLNFKAVAAAR